MRSASLQALFLSKGVRDGVHPQRGPGQVCWSGDNITKTLDMGLFTAHGMAMGAQANIVDSVHIFIAIAAHKGLAAYALGSSVVDSQVRPRLPATTVRGGCGNVLGEG